MSPLKNSSSRKTAIRSPCEPTVHGTNTFVIPASELRPGKAYRWILKVDENEFSGTFTVEPAAELEKLVGESSGSAGDASGDASLHALELAEELSAHGYRWQAQRILREALGL